MWAKALPIIVTIAFSAVGVAGDYMLKMASASRQPLRSGWFYLGVLTYASTALGWVYVMRHLKLATVGVVYAVSMVLLLTALGAAVFHERMNVYEIVGLLMAVGALVLLVRFA